MRRDASPCLRRSVTSAVIVVTALMALVTGCSSSGGSESGATSPASQDEPAVVIAHRFGETAIEGRPERVVTVGLTDHDAALAVGVAPVGVTEWFGGHPHAAWPWALDELGDATPEIVGDAQAINFEAIAALNPDLILAVYAGLTEPDYDKLSQIAPTVAQPDQYVDYGVPWDEQTLMIGRALSRSTEAQRVVDDVRAQIETARAEHPELEGARGVVASPYGGQISIYAPQDTRGRLLTALGIEPPPEIAELAGDEFSADVSYERVDLLADLDVVVWIVGSLETDVARFAAEPLYANLPVHTGGHDVFVENLEPLGGATSFVTALSIPFLLDELVPKIAAAVEGAPR